MAHILFIANAASLYGANRSAIDLAIGLQKLGQNIFFFFPQEAKLENRYYLKRELDRYSFSYLFLEYFPSVHQEQEKEVFARILRAEVNKHCLEKMEEIAGEWRIDIIHSNSLTHLIGAELAGKMKKPHVWHIREALKDDYHLVYDSKLLYRYELFKAKQIVCISDYVRKVHRKMLFGLPQKVMYDGLNIKSYILEGAFQQNPQIYKLMVCGIVQKEKGQLDAVKAVELLIHKYYLKNLQLQIVGDSCNEYGEQIREYIKAKKLEPYVKMVSFQNDLRELRKKTDIALICSRNEALGRVTIESMLSENVVVGADSAGTAEIIKDGETGYLYRAGDIEDLSRKIYHVIVNWNSQENVVKKAKEYAETNFDIDEYAKNILKIYLNLL